MKLHRALLTMLPFLLVLAVLAGHPPAPADADDWVAPAALAPGLDVSGDPTIWGQLHTKSLDRVHDGVDGNAPVVDLMGFYFDQEIDRLSFRLNLFPLPETPSRTALLPKGARVFVLIDYAPGGTSRLPEGIDGDAPVHWERAVELIETDGVLSAQVLSSDGGRDETERVRKVVGSRFWGTVEASLWLPDGFEEAVLSAAANPFQGYDAVAAEAAEAESTPIGFYVFTTRDGRVEDEIRATNAPYSATSNPHNVAFVQHGNQGLTFTTVFRGVRGENAVNGGDPANPDDGFDEILDAHDFYSQPLNWHMGGLLITAAEWHDTAFNQQLRDGVTSGRYEIVSSAYGQHIMPFLRDEINGKAVDVENDLINFHYSYTPRVAWVPERVWVETPDDDGNGVESSAGVNDYIEDDFTDNGIWAVVLDDYIHCAKNNNAFNDHHIYTYANGIKVLPIDNNFVGDVNNNAGNAWNRILAGTSDEIIIYGNDAEFVAEVSQGTNEFALGNYIWLLQQCAGNPDVGVWKLTDVLQDPGFTTQAIDLENGTYGLLGGHGGYGGSDNSWYTDYAAYAGPSNLDAHNPKWNYGTQWDFTLNKILGVPDNDLREMAWYVLLTNLHETGWHDAGEISGWQNHYANHIRSANAHAEAARWAGGLYVDATGAFIGDFEDDGADELVMYNDRLMAVFDGIGGKLQWLFAKGADYGYSVVSNDNVFWVDTDGDFNETNHVAGLSDVSVAGVNRENDFYSFAVTTGTGNNLEACIVHPSVTKVVKLNLGDPYLTVDYRTAGEEVFVKSGMSPDLLDMTWNADMDRVWDPDGGGYFGQKNPNTSATTAIVVGGAGASHNLQFDATLLGVDEFGGTGPFTVRFYGGFTGTLDGMGHVPELKTLRDNLTDTLGPLALSGEYFPVTDQLTLFFDDLVDPASVALPSVSIDENGDGTGEVALTASDAITTVTADRRINISLSPATAAALEALNPASLTLVLGAGALTDPTGNPNENSLCGNPVAAPVSVAPITKVQIDGLLDRVDPNDWGDAKKEVLDFWDSLWNGAAPGDTNEINLVLIDWDETYLYLGVQGFVSGNSWILYLDTDFNGSTGQTDLTAIDTWERGATFVAPGFKPDYHYGAFQHQGPFDSHSLWRLTSATTSVDISSQVVLAFDPDHLNGYEGGSELAIPWDVLYGLGPGQVPTGAEIAVVASVCYDPEPNGELGGDSTPSNIISVLPEIDTVCNIVVDGDNDGLPDVENQAGVGDIGIAGPSSLLRAFPNPMRGSSRIALSLPESRDSYMIEVSVFDLNGRRIEVLVEDELPGGDHAWVWDGTNDRGQDTGAGIFFITATVDGRRAGSTKLTRVR